MAAARRMRSPTPSAHRLRPGLPGYLILFAPPALAPQRRSPPRRPPSPPVFLPISAHSTATPGVPPSPAGPEPGGSGGSPGLSPGIPPPACRAACARFTPNESGQRSPPTYYRGCWHVVSRGFFCGYRRSRPRRKRFTALGPSSRTRRRCVRVAPIAQYSPLLPPVGVWAVSQSQCGRPASQPGYPSSARWAVTPPPA